MTNPTPQAPTALQLAEQYDHGDPAAHGNAWKVAVCAELELRRLHAYCQELEAQVILDCMTHVQKPAGIEHVANDVSKNRAEVNMMDLIDAYAEARHVGGCHTYNAKTAEARAKVIAALRTQQPAPATQQAPQQPCPTAPAAPALTQGAAIAAGAVYAELPDDVIDYVKGSYAFLQSTAPDGYAEEVFRLPPSATRNQRSLQDALQSDKHGWHPAAARQDSGDGKRSGPDAGVSASHGQAQAASSEVLKAIREANMQLVRTGVDAFMLVPYKVATAQAAESVPEAAHSMAVAMLNEMHQRMGADVVRKCNFDSLAFERIAQRHMEAALVGRKDLQMTGSHPAPCGKFCEAQAFRIENRNLKSQLAAARAPADSVLEDAARWQMAVLIGNEVMLHPEKRTHPAAVKAYMDAVHSGLDLTGAVDAACKQGANHD